METFVSVAFCVLLTMTINQAFEVKRKQNDGIQSGITPNSEINAEQNKFSISHHMEFPESEEHVLYSKRRKKRTIYNLVKSAGAVFMGLRATRTILSGTTPTGPHTYIKHGGLMRAVKDFGDVKPQSGMEYKLPGGGVGRWGEVGDRIIVIETRGDSGKPTIEIIQNLERTDETTDIITYID